MRGYDRECVGCGREGVYAPIGLCGRCRWDLRHAVRTLKRVLYCLASDRVLDLLERLDREAGLCDGTASAFIERTSVPVELEGWPLGREVS